MRRFKRSPIVPLIRFVSPERKSVILNEENVDISKAICMVCGKKITVDNLGIIKIKNNGKAITVCSDEKCRLKSKILSDAVNSASLNDR
jgi:hypothetical protein